MSALGRRFGALAAFAIVAAAIGSLAAPSGVDAERHGGASISTTTVVVSSPNPSQFGQDVTFIASVAGIGGQLPPGTVTFRDGATVLADGVALNSGQATFATSALAVGTHTVITDFVPSDAAFAPSAGSSTQVVTRAPTTTTMTSSLNPSMVGDQVTFTATVSTALGDPVTSGTVTFVDGLVVLATVPVDASGQSTFSTSTLDVGSHTITASIGGTATLLPSSSAPVTQQVNRPAGPPDGITLTSSLNPSMEGQAVTFTAIVTYSGEIRDFGFIPFYADGVLLGPPVVMSGETTSFTTSALPAGTHEITATWSLSPSNFLLTSPPVTQVVNPGPPRESTTTTPSTSTTTPSTSTSTSSTVPGLVETVTELTSSLNPSTMGQPVTFTATVTPVDGSAFAPVGLRSAARPQQVDEGGTLTISDGDTVLATVALEDGQASFTTSTLTAGSRTIIAAFSGTTTAAPSSATLTQQVNQAATLPATR